VTGWFDRGGGGGGGYRLKEGSVGWGTGGGCGVIGRCRSR